MKDFLITWVKNMGLGILFMVMFAIIVFVIIGVPGLLFGIWGAVGNWLGAAWLLFVDLPLLAAMANE